MTLTLDSTGQFVSGDSQLGIIATCKRGRWQYRDASSRHLYASGMNPSAFAQRFWYRDDFQEVAE